MSKAKKTNKLPNVYVHKFVSWNNLNVLAVDPGRYCGIVIQSTGTPVHTTIFSTLADLGTFTSWWKIAGTLRQFLDLYREFWLNSLNTVIIERQTSTNDTLTMIEAYFVMYFSNYNVNIYAMDRSCVYRYMKIYIPDLKYEREDMKPKISAFAWQYMLDHSGKYMMADLKRLHDLTDCIAMIYTLLHYSHCIDFRFE